MIDPGFLSALKARVDIAAEIGRSVKLVRKGRRMVGLCPFHAEKTGSFTVSPDRANFKCFGCGAKGDVVDFVVKTEGVDFRTAVDRLAAGCGMAREDSRSKAEREADRARFAAEASARRAAVEAEEAKRRAWRLADATTIWRAAKHDAAALAGYLGGPARGIDLKLIEAGWGEAAPGGVPLSLRFLANCPDEMNGREDPAMVAPIGDAADPQRRLRGVHRTFLNRRLDAKRGFDSKTMRGDARFLSVMLTAPAPRMLLGEGIETVLSVMSAAAKAGQAGGLGAMTGLSLDFIAGDGFGPIPDPGGRGITLPVVTRELILLEDSDMKDQRAADIKYQRAAARFGRGGVLVRRARPGPGLDFNDLLRRGRESERVAA